MHREEIPAWWLIAIEVVVSAYQGLSLVGNNATVQGAANRLGVGRIVTWMALYPPWQSPTTQRFGRILALSVALAFLVWGVFKAIAR